MSLVPALVLPPAEGRGHPLNKNNIFSEQMPVGSRPALRDANHEAAGTSVSLLKRPTSMVYVYPWMYACCGQRDAFQMLLGGNWPRKTYTGGPER